MALHAFAADFHLNNFDEFKGREVAGVNDRARLGLAVFEKFLGGGGVKHAHLLGDVFHHPYIYPQLMTALMEVISSAFEWGLESLDIILGNHDIIETTSQGNHCLGPLSMLPGVTVHERPVVKRVGALDIFYVPFPYNILDYELKRAPDVACMHAGIVHEGTSDFLKDSGIHKKKLQRWMGSHKKGDVRYLLAGDWHDHIPMPGGIYQVGCLVPHGWQDHGINRGHVITIDDEVDRIHIRKEPGPRFVHAPTLKQAKKMAKELLGEDCTPFVEIPRPTLEDGSTDHEAELPVIEGAFFRWAPTKRRKDLAVAEAETAERVKEVRRSKKFNEYVEEYCREKYPTRWNKVVDHVFRFLDHER